MESRPEWGLSSNYVHQVANQLAEMGVDVAAWLASQGLSYGELEHAEQLLCWELVQALFLEAERLSAEPALGLMIGDRLRINNHGVVGYAAMNSGTVRQVVTLLERFVSLRLNLVAVSHEEDGNELRLCVDALLPLGQAAPFLIGAVVAALNNIIDFITLGACQISGVSFAFPAVCDQGFAKALLRCPVKFEQDWSGITLPLSVVDKPLKTADPLAFEQAEKLCERELKAMNADASFSARVRKVMLANQARFPSLAVTARLLHMTPRTLHRRLLEEGLSFQIILDQTRHSLATEYLRQGDVSIEALAYMLGYNDAANFRRAFRRWTGMAPSAFRAAQSG